jgi:hypothetical protein
LSGPRVYVVTQPHDIRGVYYTWPEVLDAITGSRQPRFMRVSSQAEAEAILEGRGVVLGPSLFAFTDGSGRGGVGIVIVVGSDTGGRPMVVKEIATSVHRALQGGGIPGLQSDEEVNEALGGLANSLTEMAALYAALREVPPGGAVTVVHDFVGVSAFMQDGGPVPDNVRLRGIIAACHALVDTNNLSIAFVHQPRGRSTWAGRHDLAELNARADALATEGESLIPLPARIQHPEHRLGLPG